MSHDAPLIREPASVITVRDMKDVDASVPWTDHLEELRYRLWWCAGTMIASACVAFAWSKPLVAWLARPVGMMVFTQVHEALMAHVQVACVVGGLASSPVIVYHAWQFVSVGLRARERRLARGLMPWSAGLFLCGAAFGYRVMLPQMMRVFFAFSSPVLQPMISVDSYLSFVVWMVVAFGCVFELPLVMWGLSRLGVVEPRFWRRVRPVAIVVIFIVAAAVTPGPDVVSQCLVAIPMVILYEASAWLSGVRTTR